MNFILYATKILNHQNFWIAFQSNVLSDRCAISYDFEWKFKDMMEYLEKQLEYFVPKMHLNMRNPREVVEVAKTIESKGHDRNITTIIDILETWKSSITSYLPTIFPITEDTLNNSYSKVFKHVTEDGKMNVILITDEGHYDCKQIKKSLQECGVEEDDILIHTLQFNSSKVTVKNFIRKNRGVLICQDDLYSGMEAKWLCYCVSDRDWDRNLRTNILRACEKLNILYCYQDDDEAYNNFMSARMDPEFLVECSKTINKYAWKCLTCEMIAKESNDEVLIAKSKLLKCKTCIVGCHVGHKFEKARNLKKSVDMKKKKLKCSCKKHYPCCRFRNTSKK